MDFNSGKQRLQDTDVLFSFLPNIFRRIKTKSTVGITFNVIDFSKIMIWPDPITTTFETYRKKQESKIVRVTLECQKCSNFLTISYVSHHDYRAKITHCHVPTTSIAGRRHRPWPQATVRVKKYINHYAKHFRHFPHTPTQSKPYHTIIKHQNALPSKHTDILQSFS